MFPDVTKTLLSAVSRTLFKRGFLKLRIIITLLGGVPIHTRFGDLDFISKSEVCQYLKLPIVFFLDSYLSVV